MSEDVVIVGGGPAGASAAWSLAHAGRSPLLLERERAPRDKICGEFVSVEAQVVLRAMGIEPAALGAVPIDRLRLVHGSRVAETLLPFRAYGLTRRTMDAAMLDSAAAAGARIERGSAVRSIEGGQIQTATGRMAPKAVVLASGKHDVRGARRVSRGTVDTLVGFKSYFSLSEQQHSELAGYIEVVLFPGGYAGLQMVEGGKANLCLLVEQRIFASIGSWPGLLDRLRSGSTHLAARLGGARELLDRPLTIAGVPYGFRHRPRRGHALNLYRVGDQCAVIPSFSGDGMAIAMHSGRAAAQAILSGQGAPSYHAAQLAHFRRQIAVGQALYRLGQPSVMQPLLVEAARRWPALARRLASWTRVPVAYNSNRCAPSRSISDASCVT